jgi:quercetin dioxygenase-like cupin family protein
MVVSYEPNGYTPPHYHAGAEVVGYVLEGKILSKMDDMPEKVYSVGESWYERPGCHHVKSENASDSEPAKLMATFVINSDFESLMQLDWEIKE